MTKAYHLASDFGWSGFITECWYIKELNLATSKMMTIYYPVHTFLFEIKALKGLDRV